MTWRFARAVAVAALLVSSPAIAQDRCAPIRALTNADGMEFGDLRIGFAGDGGLALFSGEGTSALLPASECELSAAFGSQELNCQWRFTSRAEADGFFNTVSATLQGCTRLVPETLTVVPTGTGWQVRRRQRLSRETSGIAAQVTLDRVEYQPEGGEVEHRVFLESVIAP
jgi:hypothetical protein